MSPDETFGPEPEVDMLGRLQSLLPPGWRLEFRPDSKRPEEGRVRFWIGRPSGRFTPVVIRAQLDPRAARALAKPPALVLAPYLSPRVQLILEERGLSFADATGNVRVMQSEPGLFIRTTGAQSNPWPDEHTLTLRGLKAARVVVALCEGALPLGVRALAHAAQTDPGYVSRLLRWLESELIVERSAQGQVVAVDHLRLVEQWVMDAPLPSRASRTVWLAPQGLGCVLDVLQRGKLGHLLTGKCAALGMMAGVNPEPDVLELYVASPVRAANALGLRPGVGAGSVALLVSEDERFLESEGKLASGYAPWAVVAADCLSDGNPAVRRLGGQLIAKAVGSVDRFPRI